MKKIILDTNAYTRLLAGDEDVLDMISTADTLYMSIEMFIAINIKNVMYELKITENEARQLLTDYIDNLEGDND